MSTTKEQVMQVVRDAAHPTHPARPAPVAKLTDGQKIVLANAGRVTGFASRSTTYRLGRDTYSTAHAYRACKRLVALGLLERVSGSEYWPLWRITPAGRSLLSQTEGAR